MMVGKSYQNNESCMIDRRQINEGHRAAQGVDCSRKNQCRGEAMARAII